MIAADNLEKHVHHKRRLMLGWREAGTCQGTIDWANDLYRDNHSLALVVCCISRALDPNHRLVNRRTLVLRVAEEVLE